MAEEKRIGELTVNNGGGLLDSDGMIDAIKTRLNRAISSAMDRQYLCFCEDINNIVQMLMALRDGIRKERQGLKEQIKDLEQRNIELAEQLTGLPGIREETEP